MIFLILHPDYRSQSLQQKHYNLAYAEWGRLFYGKLFQQVFYYNS